MIRSERNLVQCVACRSPLIIIATLYGLPNAHTNRFCVVQEDIKPEVLKVPTELARSVH